MSGTPASAVRCSDPYGEGCTNHVTPGFCLPKSPYRQSNMPCQKCRYRLRMEENARLGKPPVRSGRRLKERL